MVRKRKGAESGLAKEKQAAIQKLTSLVIGDDAGKENNSKSLDVSKMAPWAQEQIATQLKPVASTHNIPKRFGTPLPISGMAPWAQEQIIATLSPELDAKPVIRRKQSRPDAKPDDWRGKEKDFQKAVETWLSSIGYAKRTKKIIESTNGKGGSRGWQIHIGRSIGNPYMLDVLLLRHDGTWLEFELKTASGNLSDLQDLLLFDKQEFVCRSLAEVQSLVMKHETDNGAKETSRNTT